MAADGLEIQHTLPGEGLPAELLNDEVLCHCEVQHQTMLVPVLGNGGDSGCQCIRRGTVLDLLIPYPDAARLGRHHVHDGFHQFMLSVAVNAGDAQDLAPAHLQAEVLHPLDSTGILNGQARNREQHLTGIGLLLGNGEFYFPSHHHRGQFHLIHIRNLDCINVSAPADNGAVVCRLLDLTELMGDDDDGLAIVGQAVHDLNEFIDLLRSQHSGGLVQDQDLRTAVQSLEDLHTLLHAHRNILDLGIGIDGQAIFFRKLQYILPGGCLINDAAKPCFFHTEHDILCNCERFHQHEVLMHHADSQLDGCIGILDNRFLTVDPDLAFIRLIQSVQDIHQCGFTGAVLAQKCVDASLFHAELHAVQCAEGAKILADPLHFNGIHFF